VAVHGLVDVMQKLHQDLSKRINRRPLLV